MAFRSPLRASTSFCLISILALSTVAFLVLSVPAVAAASGTVISQGPLRKQNSGFAGYVLTHAPVNSGKLLLQSQWYVPDADCSGSTYINFEIGIDYKTNPDAGSLLQINCEGQLTPIFSLLYYIGGFAAQSLPAQYIVSPGDLMWTNASYTIATGISKIVIRDMTASWTFSKSANEGPPIGKIPPELVWALSGPSSPLLFFYNFETRFNLVAIGGHHGFLGSFLSIPSVSVTKYNDVNATGHLLARTSSINSMSAGFTITWIIG